MGDTMWHCDDDEVLDGPHQAVPEVGGVCSVPLDT